jgi:5'(3')-deoxyribonucleotidase
MRPRLLVDVDEVLADFQTPAFAVIHKITGRSYKPDDFLVWDIFGVLSDEEAQAVFDVMEQPGFCSSLQPTPGAIEAIEELREFAEIYAVTSPQHNRHWVYERTEWLLEHFKLNKAHIIHTAAKYLVRGDAFLDDKPEHVEHWAHENPDKLAMLWHIPNTRNLGQGLLRVRSWSEVINRVRSLPKEPVYDNP